MTEKAKTVNEALSAVMEDVQAVKKGDRNAQQGYDFRGIDAVVNAVGPALRKHGVIVIPTGVQREVEHYTTARGTPMKGVTLTVDFRFFGPLGDYVEAQVAGEASDSGDKAVPKAHSVAFRTLLLQALCIPTDEPDPDAESHERAAKPKPAQSNVDPQEFATLSAQLLEVAEKLGARASTEDALSRHLNDVGWVRRALAAANKNLANLGTAA